MADVILAASGLRHDYPGGVTALCGLDLAIRKGRKLAILGGNGAGKTTLLLHLNGTLRPKDGAVSLDGVVMSHGRTALAAWRRRVGLVLQDADDQLFAASVAEDVSFGPCNLDLPEDEVRGRVAWALESLRIADLAQRPTHMLSFGQKKRVAVAGALAVKPEILLLDEPTAGLDNHGERHLLAALESLAQAGTTLVFTTHDSDLALAFADDVALFHDGRVIACGAAESVLAEKALVKQARVRSPWAVDLWHQARALGLPGHIPLPRRRDDALALLGQIPSCKTEVPL